VLNAIPSSTWDTVVVGAGAAGLATAIFARAHDRGRSVLLLDGARKPGAKILVSGGGRCNVTNIVVTERDYWGGSPAFIRRVLRAFSVQETIAFFARAGVPLHEEEDGKLFPDSNRARDVLEALLRQASEHGVHLRSGSRVASIHPRATDFLVVTATDVFAARALVLATGGLALPKSGSDGAGYEMARAMGHTLVPTTPALAPLTIDPTRDEGMHAELSGTSLPVAISLWCDGRLAVTLCGPLLWTHFGISGPVVLNVSRHWLRARLEGRRADLTANFRPGWDFQSLGAYWLDECRAHPRRTVRAALERFLPASMALALPRRAGVDSGLLLAALAGEDRRRLTHAISRWPLAVAGSRGYTYAEATAGGVALREVNPGTMESRPRPGLYLVGEILDVDGRLGGFNFQWAWSSAFVAAAALATRRPPDGFDASSA
jgi:predicted Rossmann fold flavoprotein